MTDPERREEEFAAQEAEMMKMVEPGQKTK